MYCAQVIMIKNIIYFDFFYFTAYLDNGGLPSSHDSNELKTETT